MFGQMQRTVSATAEYNFVDCLSSFATLCNECMPWELWSYNWVAAVVVSAWHFGDGLSWLVMVTQGEGGA